MGNMLFFSLIGLAALIIGFALGCILATLRSNRRFVRMHVEDDFVMAGFYLCLIEKIKDQEYDKAIDGLEMKVVSSLYNWSKNKDKLTKERIAYLESTASGSYVQKNISSYADQIKALDLHIAKIWDGGV
jgi:hypothetical protein